MGSKRMHIVSVIAFILLIAAFPALGADTSGMVEGSTADAIGPDMVLTGVFHTYMDNLPKGWITVQIGNQQWAFEPKGYTAAGVGDTGPGEIYLSEKLPSSLRLIGTNKQLRSLQNVDLNGKAYSFYGTVYVPDNIMVIKTQKEMTSLAK